MKSLKYSVTVTLDDDIAEAQKSQRGLSNKDIEQIVVKELKRCPSESGLMAEIEVEKE